MKIEEIIVGLTYDLKDEYLQLGFNKEEVAEFDSEETIIGIETALREIGFKTLRIGNIWDLTRFLAEGKKCDIVFNIAEGLYGLSREAQVPCLLDAWQIPYVFSDGMVLNLCLNKALSKQIVLNARIATAAFTVISSISEIEKISLTYPLFIKPVAEGTGKGISSKSKVNNFNELKEHVEYLILKYKQPILVEEYLPGREFTVGITGTNLMAECTGVMEICFNGEYDIYSLENKENYEKCISYKVPEKNIYEKCSNIALKSWIALNCVDGGRVDLRTDRNNEICFVEVNPLAGLNPIHSDLPILSRLNGIGYTEIIRRIMFSALNRYKML